MAKMVHGDEPKVIEMARTISEECASVVGSDRCDTGYKIMECTKASAIKHGVEPKKML